QLCADRRLRAAEPVRGAREAAQLEAGDEGAQNVHIEVGSIGQGSILSMCSF
ncbi:MAG: hypothetical protein JWO52_1735, partial [Gammaproteobacteria bacterium]|nr:hypothetical protein [Gammaproteobacteria bacterium]